VHLEQEEIKTFSVIAIFQNYLFIYFYFFYFIFILFIFLPKILFFFHSHNLYFVKGNKYGQYLAAIQVAREERRLRQERNLDESGGEHHQNNEGGSDRDEDKDDEDDENSEAPVAYADGSAHKESAPIWATRFLSIIL
jgi:hypothetical protein